MIVLFEHTDPGSPSGTTPIKIGIALQSILSVEQARNALPNQVIVFYKFGNEIKTIRVSGKKIEDVIAKINGEEFIRIR